MIISLLRDDDAKTPDENFDDRNQIFSVSPIFYHDDGKALLQEYAPASGPEKLATPQGIRHHYSGLRRRKRDAK